MSKKEKEFKRRLGKVHKHLEALQQLAPDVVSAEMEPKLQNVLDEMRESLAFLQGKHPSQKVPLFPSGKEEKNVRDISN